MGGTKFNTHIIYVKSRLSMGNSFQNPYVKHGTFLLQIDDLVQSIQVKWNFLN